MEALAGAHFVDRPMHRLAHGERERLGDVADAARMRRFAASGFASQNAFTRRPISGKR